MTSFPVSRSHPRARNGQGRYGDRDATLILIAFRHGLRAIEICDLEWAQVEFGRSPSLHVRRAKNGKPSIHPLRGDEVRALRKLHGKTTSNFVFETERGGPFTPDAVNRLIKRIGKRASFGFPWCTFICCATPAGTHWRMRGTIRALFRIGLGIGQFSIPCAIPS